MSRLNWRARSQEFRTLVRLSAVELRWRQLKDSCESDYAK